jgi:Lar family restriction alleviation protein
MLKNCPFCGGEATIERDIGEHTGMKRYTPACQKCGANIRALHSEEAAVAFWNDRAEVETLTRERDEARRKAISECICAIKMNTVLPMSTRLWDERHKAINECVNILSRIAEGGKEGDDATY